MARRADRATSADSRADVSEAKAATVEPTAAMAAATVATTITRDWSASVSGTNNRATATRHDGNADHCGGNPSLHPTAMRKPGRASGRRADQVQVGTMSMP